MTKGLELIKSESVTKMNKGNRSNDSGLYWNASTNSNLIIEITPLDIPHIGQGIPVRLNKGQNLIDHKFLKTRKR